MSQVQVESFEFLDPRKRKEFEYYGTVAGTVLKRHNKANPTAKRLSEREDENYAKMVEQILTTVVNDEESDNAAKAIEAALSAAINAKLEAQRVDKPKKGADYVAVDGDGPAGVESDYDYDDEPAAAGGAAAGGDDDDEEFVDEVLEGAELQAKIAADREREKKQKEEDERLAAIEAERQARIEEERKRNEELKAKARTVAAPVMPEGVMMLKKDDDFGGFGGGGKKGKGGKRR
eukprot:CAMPEP_0174826888 /NCGR_PEP_ID=MMETSP1114-20130205/303_1 /TAXON_ID=312471 /ORGANISM="Neobodo designis, Strain CCAP 1951/1" /LENGTH=233 /DNA_ID=CAMNT_0016060459 /DNA_START=33 /DNA_END=734 /DNA_ORIENTATION=+